MEACLNQSCPGWRNGAISAREDKSLDKTETEFDPWWAVDLVEAIFDLDFDDDLDEDDDQEPGFDPLLTLQWFNDEFMVTNDGIVEMSSAGFCVVGLGHPGSQVGVISPIADPKVDEVSCIQITLHPTFVN